MECVSITKAATLVGMSRSKFYRKYIKPGIICVARDASGRPFVKIIELARVFGKKGEEVSEMILNRDNNAKDLPLSVYETILLEKIRELETLIKVNDERLEGRSRKKRWLSFIRKSFLKLKKFLV